MSEKEPGTQVARAEQPNLLAIIAKAAADPNVNIEKMQALLEMNERLMARDAERQYDEAMARLQPKLPRITKKGEVKYAVNKNDPDGPQKHAFNFARIEDIDDAIRPLLNEEGFRFSADTIPQSDGRIIIMTTLSHVGGHSKTAQMGPFPLDTSGGKNNIQALGSVFSYGYRYGQRALLNLVYDGVDNDGQGNTAGAEPIDAESVKRLNDLIMETGSDFNKFCKFMGVEGLPEIRVVDYPMAVNALLGKKSTKTTTDATKGNG